MLQENMLKQFDSSDDALLHCRFVIQNLLGCVVVERRKGAVERCIQCEWLTAFLKMCFEFVKMVSFPICLSEHWNVFFRQHLFLYERGIDLG